MSYCYELNPEVHIEVTNDGLVVLDPSREKVLFLREFESLIFGKIFGKTEKELITELAEEYEGVNIEKDVLDYIRILLIYKIIIKVYLQ